MQQSSKYSITELQALFIMLSVSTHIFKKTIFVLKWGHNYTFYCYFINNLAYPRAFGVPAIKQIPPNTFLDSYNHIIIIIMCLLLCVYSGSPGLVLTKYIGQIDPGLIWPSLPMFIKLFSFPCLLLIKSNLILRCCAREKARELLALWAVTENHIFTDNPCAKSEGFICLFFLDCVSTTSFKRILICSTRACTVPLITVETVLTDF